MHDNDKFRWISLNDVLATLAFMALLMLTPFVLSLDRPVAADQDAAWHRRHEANSAQCRGQQYVAQCCEHARTDLTCISADFSKEQP
jgi:hypothetical protein